MAPAWRAASSMSFSRRALVLAFALGLAFARHAAAIDAPGGILVLDPSKTLIEFRLPGALHTTHGTFKLAHGVIKADPLTGKAEGEIEVDAASGDSGLGARDDRMKDSILETQKYREIIFTPQHVGGRLEPTGDFHARLEGVMSIHGSEHQMRIDADGHLAGQDLIAICHFSIPYVEWGMKDPSLPLLSVSSAVDIDVAAAGRVTWATPSAPGVGGQ